MTGNSEYRDNKTTQSFAGVPGIPGGDATPNYMQEYPTESNYESTTYNGKNAIWDSGTSIIGYKNASFANSATGLQFRADTKGSSGPIGAPGNPDSTNVYLRVKRSARPYDPWYEIYHRGNLDQASLALKTEVDYKIDTLSFDSRMESKIDNSYLYECTSSINKNIIGKADSSYVKENVDIKADMSLIRDGLRDKQDYKNAYTCFAEIEQRVKDLRNKITTLYQKIAQL